MIVRLAAMFGSGAAIIFGVTLAMKSTFEGSAVSGGTLFGALLAAAGFYIILSMISTAER